jgi:hypothetical protein
MHRPTHVVRKPCRNELLRADFPLRGQRLSVPGSGVGSWLRRTLASAGAFLLVLLAKGASSLISGGKRNSAMSSFARLPAVERHGIEQLLGVVADAGDTRLPEVARAHRPRRPTADAQGSDSAVRSRRSALAEESPHANAINRLAWEIKHRPERREMPGDLSRLQHPNGAEQESNSEE